MGTLPLKDFNLIMETGNPAKKITFQWSIRNIHKLPGSIRSSKFSLVHGQPSDWDVSMSLEDDKTFSFCLAYHAQKGAIKVKSESRILKNGVSLLLDDVQNTNMFHGGDQHPLLTQVKFPGSEEDQLVFQCSMTVYGYGVGCRRNLYSDDNARDIEELRDNYLSMMLSGEFADVEILLAGRCFSAHKCILKSLAPKFYSEHRQGILDGVFAFMCVHPERFEDVLQSLYSGTTNKIAISEDFQYFYAFGARYELKRLRRASIREMIYRMTIHNVSTYFDLAEDNGDDELLKYCEAFMKDNKRDMEASLHEKYRE